MNPPSDDDYKKLVDALMDYYTSMPDNHDQLQHKLILVIAEFLTKPFLDELRRKNL